MSGTRHICMKLYSCFILSLGAAMSISTAQKKAIQDLLDQSKTEGLLSTAKQLIEYLLVQGLAYKQRLSPMDIGVHPQNRDNVGLHDGISSARFSL